MNASSDSPDFRIWPPVALGVPLVVGLILTASLGDPYRLAGAWSRPMGWALCGVFAVWNAWALVLMAQHETALLPGGATRLILDRGPFRISRNPLYVGLIVGGAGIALLWPSTWALLMVPIGVLLLWWGAVIPQERYLRTKFGAEYADYCTSVRRWL